MKNITYARCKVENGIRDTVKSKKAKELPLSKIFWGGDNGTEPNVQITLSHHYGGQSLGILTRLFEIARQDFPEANLEYDSVNAVVLGGNRRKGMWGIEFNVPADAKMPSDYERRQSEFILGGGL
jgi:hypothetical protein